MEMSTVAVGDKVFVVREDGATKEITGQEGCKRFVEVLKGDWPEEDISDVVTWLETKAGQVDAEYVRDLTGQGDTISNSEHSLSINEVVGIMEMAFIELAKEFDQNHETGES